MIELRDTLAAAALQGILAFPGDERQGNAHNNLTVQRCAEMAYEYADAMIAARAIHPQPVTPAGGEVVLYQRRTRPTFDPKHPWTPWEDCSEASFNDVKRAPVVHDWISESRALYDHPPVADAALVAIGELIRTQDNRITAAPIFVVEQKRRICGVEDDFAEGHLWYDAFACESYDDAGKAERDADREHEGCPPIQWQRGGYVDVWEFVTACFTEQGCKDYIASNGHNLREPRIFAHGSYRNTEWHTVRDHLAALNQRGGGHG